MKSKLHKYILLGLIPVFTVLACQKAIIKAEQEKPAPAKQDSTKPQPKDTTQPIKQDTVKKDTVKIDTASVLNAPYPTTAVTGCSYAPYYGDSIIFTQPTNGSDYIVHPVNNPGAGKFLSWPKGMTMDSLTGAINVTKSETGLRYAIGFVKSGTTDTCLSSLIIGGASYMDSVYVLEDGATTAVPYYNANPWMPPVCSGGGCTFDVTGSAGSKKVIVDHSSGVIDLDKTLNGSGLLNPGAFGLLPLNGQTVTATIYYKLNDASNNAMEHIDVQVMYFYSKSNMTAGLLGSVVTKLENVLSGNLISKTVNPRPPLVIIVRKK